MPKIRKLTIRYHNNQQKLETAMHYNSDHGFYVKIPEEFHTIESDPEVKDLTKRIQHGRVMGLLVIGENEDSVVKDLETYLNRYATCGVSERLVIMYKIAYTSSSIPAPNAWRSEGTDEVKLELEYQVATEQTFGDSMTYVSRDERHNYSNRKIKSGDYEFKGWNVIDYTEEAEAFFSRIYTAMEALVHQFIEHIGEPEDAIKTIKSGLKLLEDPSSK